jgi:hypothetical protein
MRYPAENFTLINKKKPATRYGTWLKSDIALAVRLCAQQTMARWLKLGRSTGGNAPPVL